MFHQITKINQPRRLAESRNRFQILMFNIDNNKWSATSLIIGPLLAVLD